MIHLDKLCFGYDGKALLFNMLSLHLKPGENILLKGENGCGKSTLLKLMMGILSPQSGTVAIAGKPVTKVHAGLFQHVFYQSQSTADNLLGISQQQDWQMWRIAIPGLAALTDRADELFSERSGGEQKQDSQRILPYLMHKYWLLDEPFASLDTKAGEALFELVCKKTKAQPGMLVVAHELGDKESHFDRVLELSEGSIKELRHA
ncbi:MAG: hypothetical protein CVU50_01685 [Candidatus Cloacimonetes bacterium HGW-Cloacimonetes-3]|jgi:ABC-type Mn2+/Zn2+ transport system ATPase subunit|nr:MAG: hypothetical protein CVU50_01685 [Candidatus Cloacimonetes bacterium HGW-Cloacimonetes-3]